MYISYNWLKDFVKIPAKISPEEIATKLTGQTVEIEAVNLQADRFSKVVVGKILEISKHPNADRLRLVVVDVKKEKLNIVCGATNLELGQMVPVALVGANLPGGVEIKESEIRGEKSQGMICAEDELGLGKNHEGILVLNSNAKLGEAFSKYLKLDDIVFEVDNKSLSNRPDLLCHYGIARELAAIFDINLKNYEKIIGKTDLSSEQKPGIEVKIEDFDACPRYSGILLNNIEVKESPEWLKQRLTAIGQRPVNNIVDLTNYVMFDAGQPMHAFDADKIDKIIVRRASKNEVLETLDGKERVLDDQDLVIANGQEVMAIAGIMGGVGSEVGLNTKNIFLEAANFNPMVVRKTSQKLSLRTEASSRFEKSLDSELTTLAIKKYISLLKELCPNFTISGSLIDFNKKPLINLEIDLDLDWLYLKIGQEIPREQILSIFDKLGFKIKDRKAKILKVFVPSWRSTKDIRIKEDLVEEVLRLYGYDNIVAKMPVQEMIVQELNEERLLERKIKDILALKFSLSEVYNYSFVSEDQLKKAQIDYFNYLRLANPLSDLQSILRQSLASGLIANVKNNQARNSDFGFFETGNVFFASPGNLKKDIADDGFLPHQEKRLGIVISGDSADKFEYLKGIISNLLQKVTNYNLETEFIALENKPGWADERVIAKIMFLGQEIGLIGNLKQEVVNNFNLKKQLVVAEINLNQLFKLIFKLSSFHFQETVKYPSLIRDLAFVIDDKILYTDFRKAIKIFHPLIQKVELFDIYSGNKLEAGYKSLAFHLNFQSEERTLTTVEIDKIQEELKVYLVEKFGAKLRDF